MRSYLVFTIESDPLRDLAQAVATFKERYGCEPVSVWVGNDPKVLSSLGTLASPAPNIPPQSLYLELPELLARQLEYEVAS